MLSREIEKGTLVQERNLNINLGKFRGYESSVDIFTFKNDFEKLYARTTPRLLNKKMKQLKNLNSLWKLKDSEKISDALSKVINVMKDLIRLCKQHKIEGRLYNGDAIERIYRIIGDRRVTRWLSSTCDVELDDETFWNHFIAFLEKDVRVQQQKALVCKRMESKEPKHPIQSTSHRIHYANDDKRLPDYQDVNNSTPRCFICGQLDGHVITSGPRGMKHIQYFTCRTFADMYPNQRFPDLKNKGL